MKSHLNKCATCGKEYDMRCSFVNGNVAGYRPKFCSQECYQVSKNITQNARNKIQREKRIREKAAKLPTIVALNPAYGPRNGLQCFGCPFLGNDCRQMKYPLCRQQNAKHNMYLQRLKQDELMYGDR